MTTGLLGLPVVHYDHYRQHWQPVVAYFWERKRSEVLKLIQRNFERLCGNEGNEKLVFADLGCGRGEDLLLYKTLIERQCPRWEFVGVDAQLLGSESSLEAAGVDLVTCNFAKELPFRDQEVDLLYCSEVIEHLPAPEVLLQEIKRVLKPAGHLILTTPNAPLVFQRSYWNRSRYNRMVREGLERDDRNPTYATVNGEAVRIHGHISVRTARGWDNTLSALGFKKVDCGRGSSSYGCEGIFSRDWAVATFFWLETLLELVPRRLAQGFCSQFIGLYSH